jgi:multidrug efflux pump subunit AcrA (membrane-fusion protein)
VNFIKKSLRNSRYFVPRVTVLVTLVITALLFVTGPSASPSAKQEKAWPVSTISAEPTIMRPNFSAFGRLQSSQVANISSDLVAKIKQVLVKEGDWVEAGDLLVQLDERESELRIVERRAELKQAEAELLSMQSRLEEAQANAKHYRSKYDVASAKLRRHEDLMKRRLISAAQLDEVTALANEASIEYRNHVRDLRNLPNEVSSLEAQVDKAQAMLERALLDFDKSQIFAPFAGPVMAVHVAPGDYASLGSPLLQLAAADGFEVRVQVSARYARQFQQLIDAGTTVEAVIADGEALRLSRLARHVRAGQTGVDAFFVFENTALNRSLALGRVIDLTIHLPAQENLVALPIQAIYENRRIYKVKENRLVGLEVDRVGEHESAESGYQILVRSADIQPGDEIVTTQLPRAITGLLVERANQKTS